MPVSDVHPASWYFNARTSLQVSLNGAAGGFKATLMLAKLNRLAPIQSDLTKGSVKQNRFAQTFTFKSMAAASELMQPKPIVLD